MSVEEEERLRVDLGEKDVKLFL